MSFQLEVCNDFPRFNTERSHAVFPGRKEQSLSIVQREMYNIAVRWGDFVRAEIRSALTRWTTLLPAVDDVPPACNTHSIK